MISELLFQSNKVTDVMNQVWTGGVGSTVARENLWFWHSNPQDGMEYQNFWQGWSGGEQSSGDLKDNFAYGIKMSRQFPIRKGQKAKEQLTDYYFWNLDSLETKHPYICERPQSNIGCIVDEGEGYMGKAMRTQSGAICKPWDLPEIGFWFGQDEIQKLGPLQGWKFISCSYCQELCQQASWPLIGCTRMNNQSEARSAS